MKRCFAFSVQKMFKFTIPCSHPLKLHIEPPPVNVCKKDLFPFPFGEIYCADKVQKFKKVIFTNIGCIYIIKNNAIFTINYYCTPLIFNFFVCSMYAGVIYVIILNISKSKQTSSSRRHLLK